MIRGVHGNDHRFHDARRVPFFRRAGDLCRGRGMVPVRPDLLFALPAALGAWYAEHLGFDINAGFGGSIFLPSSQPPGGYTIWGPFDHDTEYFDPSDRSYMINIVVDDLDVHPGRDLGVANVHAPEIARGIRTGITKINGVTMLNLNPAAPRPAWGLSGLGDEGTRETFEFFRGSRLIGTAARPGELGQHETIRPAAGRRRTARAIG